MEGTYFETLSADPALADIFIDSVPYQFKIDNNIPMALYSSIISQQLSTKVADVIMGRFLAIYDGIAPSPEQVLEISVEQLRGVGLSNAKANYIRNVAQFALEQGLQTEKLQTMTDEEIYDYVGSIKGVGKWTVHLLLMFSLGRQDVFVADDLGIQNAMAQLFNLDKTDRKKLKKEIIAIAEKYAPYRSYLCVHLWHWLNNRNKNKTLAA